tara:strand:+ start:2085 stop:2537 length:453 start_codon:yes stop_codon:yes gene_type:complete
MSETTIEVITNNNKYQLSSKNFKNLYSQLTQCELLNEEEFNKWFESITNNKSIIMFCIFKLPYYELIGTACIYIKQCYYRSMAKSATIEDLVVDINYRGNGLGKKMIDYIIDYSKKNDIYKIVLQCTYENEEFYKKCGFESKNLLMSKYF